MRYLGNLSLGQLARSIPAQLLIVIAAGFTGQPEDPLKYLGEAIVLSHGLDLLRHYGDMTTLR